MKILQILLGSIVILWVYSGCYLYFIHSWGKEPYQIVRTIFHELKPFYLPCYVASYIMGSTNYERNFWDYLLFIAGFIAYWIYRDVDDDDRWKRRKEKLAEKVAQVGSRLAVVPAKG